MKTDLDFLKEKKDEEEKKKHFLFGNKRFRRSIVWKIIQSTKGGTKEKNCVEN